MPKLADFGLASIAGGTTAATSTLRAGAGTAAYMAPEQSSGTITTASEVYSFGIVLWELLHGGRPWAGVAPLPLMMAVCMQRQRPPVTAADSLLRQLMEQCWAQEATDRPSFADVSQRLATAVRTFATSRYKVEYEQLQARTAPLQPHELLTGVYDLINDYAQRHGLPAAQALTFFETLQANALRASAHGHTGSSAMAELLMQPQLIALRMYSSAKTLPPKRPRTHCLQSVTRRSSAPS